MGGSNFKFSDKSVLYVVWYVLGVRKNEFGNNFNFGKTKNAFLVGSNFKISEKRVPYVVLYVFGVRECTSCVFFFILSKQEGLGTYMPAFQKKSSLYFLAYP